MSSLTSRPDAFPQLPADRRLAGLALTLLVHAVLILGWQMARTLPAPEEGLDAAIQWLRLSPPAAAPVETPPPVPRPVMTARGGRSAPSVPAAVETAPSAVSWKIRATARKNEPFDQVRARKIADLHHLDPPPVLSRRNGRAIYLFSASVKVKSKYNDRSRKELMHGCNIIRSHFYRFVKMASEI
ncbi:MAG: hypothetical protein AB1437_06505 [Pseudomonadota bacterium]